jgi:hypothetical protein
MSSPKTKPPVVELSVPPQIFADDLSRIDYIGSMVHLIFASTRRAVHEPNELERVVEVRLVVSPENVQVIARAMLAGRVEPERQTLGDGDNVVPLH